MNLKSNSILITLLLLQVALFAQDAYTLTGTIVDINKKPLINVLVNSTSSSTETDTIGTYEIKVKNGDELSFSYPGYTSQSISIGSQKILNITLLELDLLDEIAIGYGTRKKTQITGTIGQIDGEDISKMQVSRVDDALAGKLAGVLIQNQDGSLGAAPKIQIRAAASVLKDASPLIIVDGYPVSGGLFTINPNDIQSIEILKSTASAAIYGFRGANGVILVTSKKGKSSKSGKARFNYDTYLSTSSRYVQDNVNPTAEEWANTIEANVADGTFDISQIDPVIYQYRLNAYKNSPDVQAVEDWLYQNGNAMNHNFSVSGNSENVDYFASVGYLNSKGIVQTEGFKRYNAGLHLNAKLGAKFKFGLNFNGFIGDRDIIGHDQRDLLRAYSIHPIYHTAESIAFVQKLDKQAQELGLTPFDEGYRGGDAPFNNSIYTLEPGMTAQDWHYGRSGNGIGGSGDAGPATKLDNTDRFQKMMYGNFSSYLQYSILDGLNLKTMLGADIRETESYSWRGLEFDSRARTSLTHLDQTDVYSVSNLNVTSLNYKKTLDKHDIDVIAGIEFQRFSVDARIINGSNVPYGLPPNFEILDPADIAVSESKETTARRSIFGRFNYAYDNRYLASASFSRDGGIRLGTNNNSKIFPAFSLGWNIHNEAFYQSDFLSALKLRFSRGVVGTPASRSFNLLNPSATVFGTNFLLPTNILSPELKFQTHTEMNYGINLGFANNRLIIGADYYNSDIENLLLEQSVSEAFGTTSVLRNAGSLTSSGLELELTGILISNATFSWNINANLSTLRTEITDLGGLDELAPAIYGQSGRGPVFRNYVGGEIGEMWGIETTGEVEMKYLNNPLEFAGQESGYSYAVDQNGDGIIDRTRTVEEGGDLVKIGQNTPDFYWGLGSQISFKDFDLSIQLQGTQGAQVYNIDPLYYGSQWGRSLQDAFDANGDGIADNNGQHYVRSRDQTDAMIQNASYTALRNLTIGYTIGPALMKKANRGSLRVYLAATNLLYLMGSDYTSFNPEGVETMNDAYLGPTTYGVQVGASPIVRSFTFGLNLGF